MAVDGLCLRGEVTFILTGPAGTRTWAVPNLLVTVGKQRIAAILGGESTDLPAKIGLGESAATPAVGDTTLTDPLGEATGVLSAAGRVTQLEALFDAGVATGIIEEGGIFTTDATMISHFLTTTFTKGPLDRLTVVWKLTVE